MIGIDEVGRGCWAGPLLIVAARHRLQQTVPGLEDSKKLTIRQRNVLIPQLLLAYDFGEGWIFPEELDEFGLAQAMRLGVMRALMALSAGLEENIIMDGTVNYCPKEYRNVTTQVGADNLIHTVSAASVWAKVTRDSYMGNLHQIYPAYGFGRHVGYGTREHREALQIHGPIRSVHRYSFKPVKQLLGKSI